jgi:hypothetical protein
MLPWKTLINKPDNQVGEYINGLESTQQDFETFMWPIYGFLNTKLNGDECEKYKTLADTLESYRQWLNGSPDKYDIARFFTDFALTLAQAISPEKWNEIRIQHGKAGQEKRDAGKSGGFSKEEYLQKGMEVLKSKIESGKYNTTWKHPDFLDHLNRQVEPFSSMQISTWKKELKKKFRTYLEKDHPELISKGGR